jgi:hypothetical protein
MAQRRMDPAWFIGPKVSKASGTKLVLDSYFWVFLRVGNKVSMIYIMDIYHDFIMIFCGENIMIYIDENIRTILL